jgi:predicted TIM-barrel fold metal-dependent hydrolase
MRYIDTHAHLGPWHEDIWTYTAEQFVVVASTAALSGELVYGNEWTIAQAERLDHLLVWLVLNPLREADSYALLERYRNHPKVVGIKLHPVLHRYPADIKAMFRLLERVEPTRLPVLSHGENESYASPARMRRLAEAFPSLTIITAHFGAGTAGQTHEALDAIQDCRTGNLITDMGTARAVRTGIVAQVVRAIGADKVLFGTDSPLYEPAVFTTLLSVAEISDAEKEQIAHGNAERIILKPRGLA